MEWGLIIFDCDGVLVDSEPISNTVLAEMLTEIGLAITFEESVSMFMGRSWAACAEMIEARMGKPLQDQFHANYIERMFQAFEKGLRPVPGIVDALAQITVPYCVASSGEHLKMRTTLGLTGLLTTFEGKMFSATEVKRSKPAPDLFLYAAEKMGVFPERCAVVEDSVAGAEAGVSAGMSVFGFSRMTSANDLISAGATVFDDMTTLPQLLTKFEPPCL